MDHGAKAVQRRLIVQLLQQVDRLKAEKAILKQRSSPKLFLVAPLAANEVEEAIRVLHCAAFTTLIPRPSNANEHTGHSVSNPFLFEELGRNLLSKAPRPGLLSLRQHADSSIVGVIAWHIESSTLKIECLAFDAHALAEEGLEADTVLDFMLTECLASRPSCRSATVNAWIDVDIDERGPLADFKGTPRDLGMQMMQALHRAGFSPPPSVDEEELEIMMGCPLDGNLPPLPVLPEGYHAHFSRPGVDTTRWRKSMLVTFSDEPECGDPYFTESNLYTSRADYHPEEVVYVECDGGEIPVAIGAGVHHAFDLEPASGNLQPCNEGAYDITYLDWIGVLPDHRGKRLGQYISLACLHSLKRRGKGYCTLWTQPHRKSAVALYKKLGFKLSARVVSLEKQLPR
jgi:ribosomal protein S18 acetylase RimI-like enzyme